MAAPCFGDARRHAHLERHGFQSRLPHLRLRRSELAAGLCKTRELISIPEETKNAPDTETIVAAQELWFKYEKDLPDVVKGLSLELHRGEFLALLGGNGTGKTTTLKLLANLKKLIAARLPSREASECCRRTRRRCS